MKKYSKYFQKFENWIPLNLHLLISFQPEGKTAFMSIVSSCFWKLSLCVLRIIRNVPVDLMGKDSEVLSVAPSGAFNNHFDLKN
jgi:hypothetical protein